MKKWLVLAVVALASGGGVTAAWIAQAPATHTEFCKAWGAIVDEPPVELAGYTLYVNQPVSNREPCLRRRPPHYGPLDGIDGVLFTDCVISWTAGGRDDAADLGIACTPGRRVTQAP